MNELRFTRRTEVVAGSRRPLSWTQIAPTLAAVLLAVPVVYAQTGSKVIPIRIAAGESITLERAAAKGDDVFELSATAGQTLAMEEDQDWPPSTQVDSAEAPRLRVFRANQKPPKDLPTPKGFADCFNWRWVNVLPTSGVYHVVVSRKAKRRYRLRISLLDPRDPIFDPGITPDRISMGGGLFPPGSKLKLKAFEALDYMDYCTPLSSDQGLPAHLCLEDKHHFLGVMSLEGLKRASPKWAGNGALAELEDAARSDFPALVPPFAVLDDAALTHWGRIEHFDSKSWRGLRWLAQYCQDNCEMENPLMYVFAAISNDGKYFIWLWVDVDYLNPPPELSQLKDEQRARLDDPKTYETFQSKVKIALTNASPKSFKPDLDELDAFARSIELR